MVGTSGSTALRCSPPVPSARSLPLWICGTVCTMELNITLVWPPTTSIMAGPPPLKGTWSMSTPAISLNNSLPRCWKLPMPAEAYCRSPGCFLASAISSATEWTGSDGGNDQHIGALRQQADRGEILDRVVVELVEPGIDRMGHGDDEQGVAVRRRLRDRLGADHAAGAAAVVDHDLLAEAVAELDGDQRARPRRCCRPAGTG